ncbi:MAG: hypothetical protein ACFB4I_17650 [Cyanophyceae cyanobacterium]
MIHHLSIPVRHPRHVAEVLSELWSGRWLPFPSSQNSYVVFPGDSELGTCIELYPLGTELIPGTASHPVQVVKSSASTHFSEVHAAISVPLNQQQVIAIAQREGWRSLVCQRGLAFPKRQAAAYQVIEVWVENRFLLELMTPEMSARYCAFMTPHNWEQYFDLELLFNASSQRFAYRSRRQ